MLSVILARHPEWSLGWRGDGTAVLMTSVKANRNGWPYKLAAVKGKPVIVNTREGNALLSVQKKIDATHSTYRVTWSGPDENLTQTWSIPEMKVFR